MVYLALLLVPVSLCFIRDTVDKFCPPLPVPEHTSRPNSLVVQHLSPIHCAGLSVFLQYKEGSSRQGKGSAKFKVPGMKWVGLRPSQLDDLDLPDQASKSRDESDYPSESILSLLLIETMSMVVLLGSPSLFLQRLISYLLALLLIHAVSTMYFCVCHQRHTDGSGREERFLYL